MIAGGQGGRSAGKSSGAVRSALPQQRCAVQSSAVAILFSVTGTGGAAQDAPFTGIKPVFVPGLYETESRNSAFKDQGVKSTTCLASADFDAFQRETIEQYLHSPQFMKACRLSHSKRVVDGFAFAMDCKEAKTIIAFRFAKDFVSSTTETLITSRPGFSSRILTVSRRIRDCPGQPKGKPL